MKNKKYSSVVTGYGYDGEGVCKVEGKVTFLPFVIEGENVEFYIEKETSSFCKGKLSKIISESPLREVPPCPYFGICGGCVYQHTNYQNELEIKKNLLAGHLKKANFQEKIEVFPSTQRYGYRNKIRLFVKNEKIGLKIRGSDKVIDVEKCLLVSDRMNDAISKIRTFITGQNLFDVFEEIVIREENSSLLVNFYKTTNITVNYQGLFLLLGKKTGIFETFNQFTRHVLGLEYLQTTEHGLACEFSPTSFHQVNGFVMPLLYEKVLDLVKGANVLNMYSGAGTLSGILLSKSKRVIGIELGDSEHQDAENFKMRNNLKGLLNMHGDCAEVLGRINEKFDTVVVDPPKAGMDKKVCERLNMIGAKRIVYISCDSATMSRDVTRLTNYKISQAYLLDMFACTGEYEALILLEKKV